MKKIILSMSIFFGLNAYSQNTIPTTTVTGALKINDSLNVNKNIVGKGEITAVDTLRAKKDIIVDGNAIVDGKLKVSGKSTFKNDIIIKKSILFDGNNEFSYTPATATSRATFYLGNTTAKTLPWVTCPNPNTNAAPQFINNGAFISRVPLGSGNPNVNSALSFFSAPWDGTGVIEVDGVDNNNAGNNGLLINYYCSRNTGINVGWDLSPTSYKDGGTVFMGAKVDMQSSLKLGWTQSGVIDLNTSIEINQNNNNGNGVKVQTWNTGVKAYSILRNDNKNTFVVYGSGVTRIGVGVPKVGGIAENAMLSVDGLILAKEVRVAVSTTTHWADYVFAKGYKLKSLSDVEQYILKHKHLPDVPSAEEVKQNGIDMLEMNSILLKKIEELTLYTISLQKQLAEQQKQINAIKK
jgi:hypothetical protein